MIEPQAIDHRSTALMVVLCLIRGLQWVTIKPIAGIVLVTGHQLLAQWLPQ